MENNVVIASFGCGRTAKTRAIYQYDYGMLLQLEGVELPTAYEVHFSNSLSGETITQIGNADGVAIPPNVLTSGANIYVWVYLHTGTDDGETVYHVVIPVINRPEIGGAEPTPAQVDVISEAIAALNDGVERAEAAADGIEETVAEALQAAKDSGEFDGPPGPKGEQGPKGDMGETGPQGLPGAPGTDGISPSVEVTETTTGAIISVTDAEGTTTALVRNGQNGSPGAPGAPGMDGISPTITITDITGGHRVTITDAEGAHSFDVMDGDVADAPVQSVNGQTGAVVLDAQDVGAGTYSKPAGGIPASDLAAGVIPTVPVQDVQVNGASILDAQGVANVKVAGDAQIAVGSSKLPVGASSQALLVYFGLARAANANITGMSWATVGTYTESAKSAISQMLNGYVSISGTTPSITALPGIRYVCGEVATLDITLPASGIVDVVFESGSTATVLTITPPTGQTLKWANGFDPTALEANTVYEIRVRDGYLASALAWA